MTTQSGPTLSRQNSIELFDIEKISPSKEIQKIPGFFKFAVNE